MNGWKITTHDRRPPNLGQKVCESLGLDPEKVAKITITIEAPGDVGTVLVRSPPFDEADGMVVELSRYRLELIDRKSGTESIG